MPDRPPQELAPTPSSTSFELGDWHVDPAGGTISRGNLVRRVQPRVMDFLCCLARNPRRTLSVRELRSAVWGDVHVVNDVVWRCVSLAREALEDDREQPRYIQTVPRRGYRLVARVQTVTPSRQRPERRLAVPGWVAATVAAVVVAAGLALATTRASRVEETARASFETETRPSALRTASDFTRSGREYYRRYRPDDLDRAAVQFQRALDLEPEYAPALAGLADTYVLQSAWGRESALAERALESARRALALDPSLPEGYRSLGLVQLHRGRVEASLEASLRALELRPDWAPPMFNVATAQAALGHLDDAVMTQRRVVAVDPRPAFWGRLAWLSWELGLEGGAVAAAREALLQQPFEPQATAALASLELEAGRPNQAWATIEPALEISPGVPALLKTAALTRFALSDADGARHHLEALSNDASDPATDLGNLLLAAIDLRAGREDEAHARLSRAGEHSLAAIRSGDERWEPRFQVAVWSAAQGESSTARLWLERAVDHGFRDHRLLEAGSPLSVVDLPGATSDLLAWLHGALDSMRARAGGGATTLDGLRISSLPGQTPPVS